MIFPTIPTKHQIPKILKKRSVGLIGWSKVYSFHCLSNS